MYKFIAGILVALASVWVYNYYETWDPWEQDQIIWASEQVLQYNGTTIYTGGEIQRGKITLKYEERGIMALGVNGIQYRYVWPSPAYFHLSNFYKTRKEELSTKTLIEQQYDPKPVKE